MDQYEHDSTKLETYWDKCFDINFNPIDKSNPPWTLEYDKNKGYYAISNHHYHKGIVVIIIVLR